MQFLNAKNIKEKVALELTFQIALGLNYLHRVGICHRDIKPENILIKDNYLKIADFGFAAINQTLTTHLGTKPYMSPEFFNDSIKEFTPKIDLWALNTCLYLFLTGEFFFYRKDPKEMQKLILHVDFNCNHPAFVDVSEETKDLLKKGYMKNQDDRPSMDEYIRHPAFVSLINKYQKYIDIPIEADPKLGKTINSTNADET